MPLIARQAQCSLRRLKTLAGTASGAPIASDPRPLQVILQSPLTYYKDCSKHLIPSVQGTHQLCSHVF